MNLSNQFSLENLLMSVGGHLLLVAIMITSFALVVDRAKLVAPDRIEILEIDLDSVKVTGDETKLYNIAAEPEKETKTEPVKEPEPVPVEVAEESKEPEKIESTTLVEEEKPKETEKAKEAPKKKVEETPAPKKKRVIRVNREVMSLDRTLTISVVDALRVAMTRCWVIDSARLNGEDIRAVAHLTMRKNGTVRDVWFESAARAETDPVFSYVLGTIKQAIEVCQPFKMLPAGEFEKWEKIQLTFYPTQGKVM